MGRLFGTDGVRGLANADLSAQLALHVAEAAAIALTSPSAEPGSRPSAVVGRDSRASGEMLQAAVAAGLMSRGVDVLDVGVLPTPAVAFLTGHYDASMGVMISASHNPMPDNGIKIFATGGRKLDDSEEDLIESVIASMIGAPGDHHGRPRPTGADIGRMRIPTDASSAYLAQLSRARGPHAGNLTVVVDCANGAASVVGPQAYRSAGAVVIAVNSDPNGLNINDGCGSTHLEGLQRAVVQHGADLGIAHDGDADRCLAVDAAGAVVDGDAIMAILALAMDSSGELAHRTLVTTVMSNLGLHIAMRAAGIEVVTTAVGDRYVLEALREGSFTLGGEQSGHVVFPDFGTTGDGILTALRLMDRMNATHKSLAELASAISVLPQVLLNVAVSDKAAVAIAPTVLDAVAEAERLLGDRGRVLLRPSGTEQLVRVMVEATHIDTARRLAESLASRVAQV